MKDIRVDNWMENAERAGADLIASFYAILGVPEPTAPSILKSFATSALKRSYVSSILVRTRRM